MMTWRDHKAEAERLLENLEKLSKEVAELPPDNIVKRAHLMDIAMLVSHRSSIHAHLAKV